MSWLFIIIRTFPFWAIPVSIALITTAATVKGKKLWGVLGVVLIILSFLFLFYQGHFKAVPFVHELFHSP